MSSFDDHEHSTRPSDEASIEATYARYLARLAEGEQLDFESWCVEQGSQAAALRELHARHAAWGSVFGQLDAEGLVEALRINSREHGASGLGGDEPGDDLLERLRTKSPARSRYRMLGELGRGGMGAVVKVWDEQIGRALAMKVVLGRSEAGTGGTPLVAPRTLGRFLEEARITGQLDHPGIVPVHELGLGDDGRVYFTMRLVRGEDLHTVYGHVREGRDGWTTTRAVGVLLKACEALSYAHDRGVVHRDLKPANIMVGKYGEVYVMDWGLARVEGGDDRHDVRPREEDDARAESGAGGTKLSRGDDAVLTMDGDVLGTPSYMAPEQARGDLAATGPRSDIYSLGAMLHHLLALEALEAPYVRRGDRATPREVLRLVRAGPPQSLERLAPDAPPELVAIASKAMAREPRARYASMRELAADLRAFLEGQVVAAYETGAWAEARKWVKRNRGLTAALGLALCSLVAGAVVAIDQAEEARASEGRALAANLELDQRNAELEAQARDLLLRGMIQELARFRAESARAGDGADMGRPSAEWWLAEAEALVSGSAGDGSAWRPGLADVLRKLDELRAEPGLLPYAEEDRQRDRANHPMAPKLAELEKERAELAAKPDLSLQALEAQRQWHRRMLGLEPWPTEEEARRQEERELASIDWHGLYAEAGRRIGSQGERVHGQEMRALVLARRSLELAPPEAARGVQNLVGVVLMRLGRHEEARREFDLARPDAEGVVVEVLDKNLALIAAEAPKWGTDRRAEREAELAALEQRVATARKLEEDKVVPALVVLDERIAELRSRCEARRTWRFATASRQWWHDQLQSLADDLDRLRTQVEQGARSVRDADALARWTAAIDSIASSERYAGQRWPSGAKLVPQLGLLPLEQDPRTGLWEFLLAASGDEPARSADGACLRDEQGRLLLDDDTGVVLVLVPGGRMPLEQDLRNDIPETHFEFAKLDLDPYFLAKHELTNQQWDRVSTRPWLSGPLADPSMPAGGMNWLEGRAMVERYVGWVRLPTAAQWEYACRAGTRTPWWTGADEALLVEAENVKPPGMEARPVRRVGTGPANPWGFHDIHGNVWEWCADALLLQYELPKLTSRPGDGLRERENASYRLVRGGASSYGPAEARSYFGTGLPFAHRVTDVGMRLARPVTR
jgi:serine/threonine protein kinase/formylglycine-generating enzyme required for sulfatase activity/uncharacterized protein YukE